MSIYKFAEVLHRLMVDVLGYKRYGAQGGDWGAYAASRLGYLYPESVLGIHLSYVVAGISPYTGTGSASLSKAEKAMLKRRETWDAREGGYEHVHSTKPQSLAYALTDSPVGLAGWMVEKWHGWTDCNGRLASKFTKEELLANISWYWLTRTAGSALQLYYESQQDPWALGPGEKVTTPVAIASFPKEIMVSPREWAERLYNVARWTDMPRGGHFAAIEEPELLANDVREFFHKMPTAARTSAA
jgi:pimeloyl-ACP methyl ester carboxylesterase